MAGEGRRGVSTKAYVSGEKTCVDHGFKISFVGGGKHVDVGPKADQLPTCRAFIQIKGKAPRRVVVLLEGAGFIRARVKKYEQQLQKTKTGLNVGVRDIEVRTEETPHDTDHSGFR